jgi:hypothetical protein
MTKPKFFRVFCLFIVNILMQNLMFDYGAKSISYQFCSHFQEINLQSGQNDEITLFDNSTFRADHWTGQWWTHQTEAPSWTSQTSGG